jgi:membrane-associated phospholipid phosphatase
LRDLRKEYFKHAGRRSARHRVRSAHQPVTNKSAIREAHLRGILATTFGPLARAHGGAIVQSRVSPISLAACLLTFALGAVALIASIANEIIMTSLPNTAPLVVGAVALDVASRFMPESRFVEALRTVLYGLLYLVTTILCGMVAAYAMQRFAFPLRDDLFARADLALGFHWADLAHWVDGHLGLQRLFYFSYHSLTLQIALPLVVLAVAQRLGEVRVYLLAFTIAFIVTLFISAMLPAAGPIVFVDRAAFHLLEFTGATPLDHLVRLREAGPLIFADPPGGIATFPSFHATVAVLTPLTLRRHHRILVALLVLNGLMLAATITEGAHYFVDVLAGIAMAFFAYALARRIIAAEDSGIRREYRRARSEAVEAVS